MKYRNQNHYRSIYNAVNMTFPSWNCDAIVVIFLLNFNCKGTTRIHLRVALLWPFPSKVKSISTSGFIFPSWNLSSCPSFESCLFRWWAGLTWFTPCWILTHSLGDLCPLFSRTNTKTRPDTCLCSQSFVFGPQECTVYEAKKQFQGDRRQALKKIAFYQRCLYTL